MSSVSNAVSASSAVVTPATIVVSSPMRAMRFSRGMIFQSSPTTTVYSASAAAASAKASYSLPRMRTYAPRTPSLRRSAVRSADPERSEGRSIVPSPSPSLPTT